MCKEGFFWTWKWVVCHTNSLPAVGHDERAELNLEKVAWRLWDCRSVVKRGKEVLAAGQVLVDVRGKQLMR